MLRYFLYFIGFAVVAGLIAGGFHLLRVKSANKKELAAFAKREDVKNKGKVLVVYYSLSGNTKKIAEKIKNLTNGDIYEIRPKEKINSLYAYTKTTQQLKNKNYPETEKDYPDFAQYDYIFVGAPVWMYTMATPLFSFLQSADFKGKKVVPFSTQGSNYGKFFTDFAANANHANIQKGEKFNNLHGKYAAEEENKIVAWINSI